MLWPRSEYFGVKKRTQGKPCDCSLGLKDAVEGPGQQCENDDVYCENCSHNALAALHCRDRTWFCLGHAFGVADLNRL